MNPQGIYSLVSYGKATERQMDSIANNLANVDTVGYKSDQPSFASVFAQAMGVASESDEEQGPQQQRKRAGHRRGCAPQRGHPARLVHFTMRDPADQSVRGGSKS